MEYFTPIIQNMQAYHNHENYEISNLGHVRRIGTMKNLRRYQKGFWSDPIHKIKVYDEDVEDNILDFNNIKKLHISSDIKNIGVNCIDERYKEFLIYVCHFNAVPIDMLKINIGFGTKIYKQENKFYNPNTPKQNNQKMPYGTIFKTTNKLFNEVL